MNSATENGLVRAKYAVSIIRLAADAERNESKRLVDLLATESPNLSTHHEVIEAEVRAIAACRRLAASLGKPDPTSRVDWADALEAVENWERAASLAAYREADTSS